MKTANILPIFFTSSFWYNFIKELIIMNFRTVSIIVDKYWEILENIETREVSHGGIRYLDVTNYEELINAVKEIQKLGFINFEISELEELGLKINFQSPNGEARMEASVFNKFKTIIEYIQRETVSISILLAKQLPAQNENSLTIELPNYELYSDLAEGIKSIEKIFQLALPDKAKDQIKIQNFDSGSLWLEIGLMSSVSLCFIGGMVKVVSNIFVKIQQAKISQQQVEEAVSDSKQRQAVKEALKNKLIKDLESDSISFLNSQGEDDPSPERINEVAKAFEMLGDLMDQGANFTPAYNALETVKEAFPNQEFVKSLPTTAKQIASRKQLLLNEQQSNNVSEDTNDD